MSIRQSIYPLIVRESPLNNWLDVRMVKLTGFAASEFLQGYVTCNTERISSIASTPFAACSLQGRVIANGWAIQLPDAIGLIVHHSIVQPLRDYLNPYLRFSKCTLDDSEDFVYVTTTASAVTADLIPGWHLVREINQGELPDTNAPDASPQINEQLINQRQVLLQQSSSGRHLPQMLALEEHGAIDFDRGCYLGQEVVARTQFRGAVKRGLAIFTIDDPAEVALGSAYETADAKGDVVMVGAQRGLWVTRL